MKNLLKEVNQRWLLRINLIVLFLIVSIFLIVYFRDRQAWKGVKPGRVSGVEQSLPAGFPKSSGKRLPVQFVVPEEQKEKMEKIPSAPEDFENYERERRQEEKNPGTPFG
ncbi:MAG: hypothetical protein COX46_04110 [bacterium (Candidatus Ratteibacteria) CG23_combo_of_CG06-09_8_20_14_all_48_7]|uniref:Uncharacterized protein n=1 Tax=bacterium (Candidatus Ratteibacteria) CG23_combo_of_CG06-09_8_20_14_all_48_7 TaxID=2014292 RepID=A0A2G9YAB8_9BACT|nr:MAG: hypothetical protein COX46_04110 [bacterium (Candidatus Ratteibacteria) CG23_combo_of_CG06-09_8_20_14_all_48_7]